MSSTSKTSTSSSRTPTKRVLTELSAFASARPSPFILSLQPSPSSLLTLHAILSGSSLPVSTGYQHGRWLLKISIPSNYPNAPPTITFLTKICHANVDFQTGEVCLDVLKENWTPVLGMVGALESVGRLLGEPGPESPLGVEVGALLRAGDHIGARGLVGFWCGEERWEGGLEGFGEEGNGAERERQRARARR
ncbi:related to PEX4-E2 ubiquitin-conjugating enzyme-peroxin [Rhynchosporium agropyri]|uniref:Related to PEX4-E2 ubiquitin-conjugating enzyme-peroxin n=1 Tax=Rhynchosporium agropyri TaxID=914238 RepID=A0A1E1KC83_9HELO|nr:related to PEX4-E2 ubiquitin-conjugating enzyme-peroxin [Rhynchosporium agropyri]